MDKLIFSRQTDVILNVDDNDAKRYTVTRVLKHAGFEVIEGVNGAQALQLAQSRPSLIILDVKLPDMDGFDVCRQLKADPATSAIPVVHLSATYVGTMHKVRGLDDGADGYLCYPVEAPELVATIRSLVRLREAEALATAAARDWDVTFDAIADSICVLNADMQIKRCNAEFSKLVRFEKSDVVGSFCPDMLRNAIGLPVASPVWLVPQGGDCMVLAVDNGNRSLQIRIDPVTDTGGSVLIISDITARCKAEERLAAAFDRERRIAESLQRSFLITVPENIFSGLALASFYEPAWDEASVGGDFYDTIQLAGNKVVLVVGDASGKGLSAAARTAEVKFALRAFLHEHRRADVALLHLNNFICGLSGYSQDDLGNIVVVSVAIIDTFSGSVEFASAGAEPVKLMRSSGELHTVSTYGLPIGAFRDAEYTSERLVLAEHDTIYMVTDGITEARRQKEFLGEEGLDALIRDHYDVDTLRGVGTAILDGARDYAGGKFQDDACLLIARRV